MINEMFLSLITVYAQFLGNNLGLAIIGLTLSIRVVLLPIIVPSLKSSQQLQTLKPEIDKLKKKHKDDKQALSQATLKLYKTHKVNPAAGCLPQIVQIVLFIAFYQALISSLNANVFGDIATNFFWLDLIQPDKTYILPVMIGLSQLVLSLAMMPPGPKKKPSKAKSSTSDDMQDAMRMQMTYFMPAFTAFIATRFPSGLALYWFTSTTFSLVQQLAFVGTQNLQARFSLLSSKSKGQNGN